MLFQQILAFMVVAVAAVAALFHLYRGYVAKPLSQFLLKRGQVKLAMKMRVHAEETGCGSCGSDSSCHPKK